MPVGVTISSTFEKAGVQTAAQISTIRSFQRQGIWYGAMAMDSRLPIPVTGLAIALVTAIALLFAGVEPGLAVAILVLWGGSLFLSTARPPESRPAGNGKIQERDDVRALNEPSDRKSVV